MKITFYPNIPDMNFYSVFREITDDYSTRNSNSKRDVILHLLRRHSTIILDDQKSIHPGLDIFFP
jgi:hypothetical protein